MRFFTTQIKIAREKRRNLTQVEIHFPMSRHTVYHFSIARDYEFIVWGIVNNTSSHALPTKNFGIHEANSFYLFTPHTTLSTRTLLLYFDPNNTPTSIPLCTLLIFF